MQKRSLSLLEFLPSDWEQEMDKEKLHNSLKKIENYLVQLPSGVEVVPEIQHVFRAFELCRYADLKVVIIGQDPYPTEGHATGLAFSTHRDVRPLPKSLLNIFKELELEGIATPKDGDLSFWAQQGVLLLNTALTTEVGKPNAHQSIGWAAFIKEVFRVINRKPMVIGLFWGNQAEKWSSHLSENAIHKLFAPHPSPLSAYRGFFGCNHFNKTNEILEDLGIEKIQW